MGRLDGQRAVHIDRESVMSGDKALFLDLTDKVEDLLGPAHCKGRDHNVSVTVQGPLDDLRELLDMLVGPVVGTVTVGTLHYHIVGLIRVLRILDQRFVLVSDITRENNLLLYAVLIDPDFNGCGSKQVSHIRKPYFQSVADRQDITIMAWHEML